MRSFLHVGIAFHGSPKVEELEPIFNKATDWLRYAPNCWIVFTGLTPRRWHERLKPHLDPQDHLFVVLIDVQQRSGFLPRWAWDWIKKDRTDESTAED